MKSQEAEKEAGKETKPSKDEKASCFSLKVLDITVPIFNFYGKFSLNGTCKLDNSCARVTKSRLYESRVRDHVIVHLNVSTSAHNCGCVVDGSGAMAAI